MKILLLTPLTLEYRAVAAHLDELRFQQVAGQVYEQAKYQGKNAVHEIILCQTGATNKTAAIATERAVKHFQPDVAILCGVAGGIKDARLGDVVIGTKIYDYESGKVSEQGMLSRPDVINPSVDLISLAQWVDKDQERKKQVDFEVFFGAIAAGEKVVAATDSDLYRHLKTAFNDTLAVEMEAFGFGKVFSNYPRTRFAVVRGVSDLVDHKAAADESGSQPKAAANAASFVYKIIDHLTNEMLDSNKAENQMQKANQAQPKNEVSGGKNMIVGNNNNFFGAVKIGDETTTNYFAEATTSATDLGDPIDVIGVVANAPSLNEKAKLNQLASIRKLIELNKIRPALIQFLHLSSQTDERDTAIMLASRWNKLRKENTKGTLSRSQYNIEYNRILEGLLRTLDEL